MQDVEMHDWPDILAVNGPPGIIWPANLMIILYSPGVTGV